MCVLCGTPLSALPLPPIVLQLFTTTEEEVWKHVTKEVVVEEAKEMYIPVEQQHGSLVHMDSESE